MSGQVNRVQGALFELPPARPAPERPSRLLMRNSRLRRDPERIWNWTLPALAAELPSGRKIVTCPSAGTCADICYALFGTYRFRNVLERHVANLRFVVEDLEGWERVMRAELGARRFRGAAVRIHDAGDFFSDAYLAAWLRIIDARREVFFYAYTKEVRRFKRMVEPQPPPNLAWVYSLGGKHDAMLDLATDRVADVFPTEAAITEAGWHSQAPSDLLAVRGPSPVGMSVNRIPTAVRLLGNRTLGQMQQESDRRKRALRASRRGKPL
ncbi:GP88 family protein [Nonomuraea helvata]|uniref:Gene product 88 domain-containing protein n=1 Tax=Nonomuraea helvata TaxID=37484 RepID=A0ABV5SKG9_9ACTN